jgi:carbonic anhydrase/acetyltransferase-like protein (isoleucine patch superfamily)
MGTLGRVVYSLGKAARSTGQALDRLGSALQGGHAFKDEVSKHQTIMSIFDKTPVIQESAFVAPSASVVGEVQIGEKSSIWYGCVLRGDVNHIKVGSETNIQDNTLVHVAKTNVSGNVLPTVIGNRVTIGHNSVLHACTVEDEAFVGMGSTILDGAVVEKGAMVAAGSVVTQKTRIPTGQIWAGSPAKFLRELTEEEQASLTGNVSVYTELAELHAQENAKTFGEIEADKALRRKWDIQSDDYDSHLGIIRSKRPEIEFPNKMISKGPH